MTGRDRIVLIVVLVAGLAAGGWFFAISPQRDQAAKLAGQVDAARAERDSALQQLQAGLAAKQRFAHDYATVARLGTAVPDDDNVASLLVQLQAAARATQTDFRTIKVGSGSASAAPPPVAPTTTTGAVATQLTTATLPPGAAVGAAGFPTMPFSFTFTGNFFHLSDFVGRLERFLVVRNNKLAVSGRFMTVDGISLSAAQKGFPRIKVSIAATTYLVPSAQGVTDGATAAGPATDPSAAAGQTASTGGAGSSLPAATAVTP